MCCTGFEPDDKAEIRDMVTPTTCDICDTYSILELWAEICDMVSTTNMRMQREKIR